MYTIPVYISQANIHILTALTAQANAWQITHEILSSQGDQYPPQAKIFSAQTLRSKVRARCAVASP